jgi:hypothetical protein
MILVDYTYPDGTLFTGREFESLELAKAFIHEVEQCGGAAVFDEVCDSVELSQKDLDLNDLQGELSSGEML